MENITKALLIIAGVLIVIMVLSLVMVVWNQISDYEDIKHEEKMLQQLQKFNSKFENYTGQTIRGNELISIMNKIVDYNNYQSGMIGFERINITIDLKNHQKELLDNNVSGVEKLFKNRYIKNESDDEDIKDISELSGKLTSEAKTGISGLTEAKLQKLSANIHNIAYDDISNLEEKKEYIEYRRKLLKQILGRDILDSEISKIKKATYLYNQLTKFKRAMFKCTNIIRNSENGRINGMQFEVVLEENISGKEQIKFE